MTDTAHLEPGPEVPTAREVRAEIRDWRRGRAELRWGEVLSDGYIAIFCVVMIGAMGGNVVLTLRRLADDTCAGSCTEVRAAMPWLAALAVALLALGLARLLGPVFSPPAANAWLLSTPVDRGALLRPGWGRTSALAVAIASLVLLAPAVLGGFSLTEGAVFLVAGGATALACVGIAALSQVHENRVARVLTWMIAAGLWVLLSLSATQGAGAVPGVPLSVGLAAAVLLVGVAVALFWRTRSAMAGVSRRVLGYTAHLSPSLSGALSSVDLGLMYDVLLARRWGRGARVRPRTGGPLGWPALVHRDLIRAVVLVTTLLGLLGGPAMCSGLRVVVRTQSLARMLPLKRKTLLLAHLAVPGAALLLFSLATIPTLLPTHPSTEAANLAIACALSSLASTTRWVTGKPPNYAAPMVSTPAGGVPTGVFGSLARGFDVWAFTALPLMFGTGGMMLSSVISIGVISYLVSDSAA